MRVKYDKQYDVYELYHEDKLPICINPRIAIELLNNLILEIDLRNKIREKPKPLIVRCTHCGYNIPHIGFTQPKPIVGEIRPSHLMCGYCWTENTDLVITKW